jgi:signal transduction histidine kinase
MRTNSLAFRLLATSLVGSIIVLALTGVVLSRLFRAAIEDNFDQQLELLLDRVVASVERSREGQLREKFVLDVAAFSSLDADTALFWQVYDADGKPTVGLASFSLLERRLSLPSTLQVPRNQLLKRYLPGPYGQRVRAVVLQIELAAKPTMFIVAGPPTRPERQVADFNRALLIALSLVAAGLAIAVFLQVHYGLRPLRRMRRALTDIRSGKQDRLTGAYPVEIESLANELNVLLRSNQEIIERARTHVGNLAHALKTPLSVVTNEAAANRSKFAAKVVEQAQVMRDQVNLYLDRARMAARARVIGSITELAPVVASLARTLERINAEKGIKAHVTVPQGLTFRGEKQDLEEMLGNLLDNAFKWARSSVAISAKRLAPEHDGGPQRFVLMVDDDGPGLPPERRADALKRGRRLDETVPGSGLGLSIVTELADLYDGNVALGDAEIGGLRVEVTLPAARDLA